MGMLYMYFLADAMFYNNRPERRTKPFFIIGPLSYDLYDLVVGFVMSIIVFPPTFLAVVLFRRSSPIRKRENRVDAGVNKGNGNEL